MPFVDHDRCPFFTETQKHIDKFGDQGLRTLAFAGRVLAPEEYADWSKRFTEASSLSKGREDALRQLASEIEEGHLEPGRQSAIFDSSTPFKASLVLHGVTALEDKLQENVGNCIAQLAKAMIKIWVLTGRTSLHYPLRLASAGCTAAPLAWPICGACCVCIGAGTSS
jgi:magnesium-transporting ATPase (P-type)